LRSKKGEQLAHTVASTLPCQSSLAQAGSAVWWYGDIRHEFQQAQTILATVISRPPRVKALEGASIPRFGSEEHSVMTLPEASTLKIGDRVELIPSHGCRTCNLHRQYVVHQDGLVTDIWPIEGSGRLT